MTKKTAAFRALLLAGASLLGVASKKPNIITITDVVMCVPFFGSAQCSQKTGDRSNPPLIPPNSTNIDSPTNLGKGCPGDDIFCHPENKKSIY
jgi:hypothetical protein